MRTVTHREMRNNSGELLRAVAAGETIEITNNGEVAAVMYPPGEDVLSRLRTSGAVRTAKRPVSDLAMLQPNKASISTAEIIADARGKW